MIQTTLRRNIMDSRLICFGIMLCVLAFICEGIRAEEEPLKLAEAAWKKRESLEQAQAAVKYFRKAAESDPKNEKIWVDLAMACYWLGEITPEAEEKVRLAVYEEGERAALKAVSINPRSVGGNFWSVVNNGRVTELKGLLSGSFNFGMCLRYMVEVSSQDPDYYYGGVYRYWGRFVYRLPKIGRRVARFSLDDSIELYQKALEIEPDFFMTRLYLAESYLENGQREDAFKELMWLSDHSPEALPEASPENRFYQRKAREILAREFKGEPE